MSYLLLISPQQKRFNSYIYRRNYNDIFPTEPSNSPASPKCSRNLGESMENRGEQFKVVSNHIPSNKSRVPNYFIQYTNSNEK